MDIDELLEMAATTPISDVRKRELIKEWREFKLATGDEISLRDFIDLIETKKKR